MSEHSIKAYRSVTMKIKAYLPTDVFSSTTTMSGCSPVSAPLLLPLALTLRSVSGELLSTH